MSDYTAIKDDEISVQKGQSVQVLSCSSQMALVAAGEEGTGQLAEGYEEELCGISSLN